MTRERLNELVRTSGDRLNYALGREAAIEKIADGMAESYIKRADLVAVFGIEWARGFIEYFSAWEIVNKK